MRTRSNVMSKKHKNEAGSKKPASLDRSFRVGDRVRIVDISPELKDVNYDLRNAEAREMRTAELFRFCLGRVFTVRGFGRYGTVEFEVDNSPAVREKFGKWQTIWSEPGFLKLVSKGKAQARKQPRKRLSS